MAVFAVVAAVSAGLLGQALKVTRSNDQRVVAANLAAQHVEQLRSLRALDIPDGAQTQDVPVGSTVYTVTRNANYVSSGTSASLCTGSANTLAFELDTVTVTWPDMRGQACPQRHAQGARPRRGRRRHHEGHGRRRPADRRRRPAARRRGHGVARTGKRSDAHHRHRRLCGVQRSRARHLHRVGEPG